MKYIMLETDEGAKLPILFPDALVHADIADLIQRLIMIRMDAIGVTVASAGFVELGALPAVAGESESLKKVSNPMDALRIWAGTSVQYMPDDLLTAMAAKLGRPSEPRR